MKDQSEIEKRLKWILLYKKTQRAGLVCLRCGISRPTLRKWIKRYNRDGKEGLKSHSRRPNFSPASKIFGELENKILLLRKERRLGARRIQNELIRLHGTKISLATIHKALKKAGVKPLSRKLSNRKSIKRYQKKIPGERVQLDVCKISTGLYQYTAIDDCTRYRVLALYSRRTAANTLKFLEKVVEEMPFPIQRVQTDRGREFFAYKVQELLMKWAIKFRPIKPASPHLNGKVERSQQTDLQEFYPLVDLNSQDLEDQLQQWQHDYNWNRPHSALEGKCTIDKVCELTECIPLRKEVETLYDPKKESIQEQNYYLNLQVRRLKRCL